MENKMTYELKPHPLAKWIKAAADGHVVRIKQNGTWDEWHHANLQTLCSINPDEFSFEFVAPRDWYLVILLRDMLLMQISNTRAEAQKWLDAFTVCPESYEIIHVIEVIE